MTADCVTLWIGDSLGPVERACMRSVMRQGHSLALYCYGRPERVPEGVEVRDASNILSEAEVMFHRNGSPGLFADWFRLELQRRALGTWVDLDMYLLEPIDLAQAYLLAEEYPGLINNAVLRLPPDSPVLPLLIEPFEKRTTPSWLPWHRYLWCRAAELLGGKADLSRLPWGTTGAYGLTALARRFGLYSLACPPDVFYPTNWRQARWIVDPRIQLADVTTDRTKAVHLSNQCIMAFKNVPAPEGSFLSRLQREGAD